MKNILIILSLVAVAGCGKSAKDADIKDQSVSTQMNKGETVAEGVSIGVNEDEDIMVQDKVQLTEHLRQLVYTIKSKQDELYGSKRFSTRGLYGKLEACVTKLNKKKGTPGAKPLATREIVLGEKELGDLEAGKFGYDEKGQLVALDETKLRDKIRDLEGKRRRLYEKEEELLAEMSRCESELE